MRIVTYANPFKINENTDRWELITTHPHFCASDTLVQGVTRYYGRDSFTHIRPVQELIDTFLGAYTNNPVNDMQMFLTVSDYIRSWSDSPMKQAFLFNKAEVVHAIQLLIPLKCDPAKFDKSQMSEEQQRFIDILSRVIESECYKPFERLDKLNLSDYKNAINETTRNEISYICNSEDKAFLEEQGIAFPLKNLSVAKQAAKLLVEHLENSSSDSIFESTYKATQRRVAQLKSALDTCRQQSEEYYSKVIIHGVHKITPIMYYMVNRIEEQLGVEVVFLINYASNIPAIYGTWDRVYNWCDTAFEFAAPIDLSEGRSVGKNIALVLSGKAPQGPIFEELISFDNLTSFAMHEVSNTYTSAGKKLPAMKTQYYAVNGRHCNELLQIYFPEQFSQKPFLSYPIGQFVLGLYNMWDFEAHKARFNFTSLAECAASGLFQNRSNILEILRKTDLFFSDVETYEEYQTRLNLLRAANGRRKNDPAYQGWSKIAFFSLNDEELEDFSYYIDSINSLSTKLFSGIPERIDYIGHFRKLIDIISSSTEWKSNSRLEEELLNGIKERLSANVGVKVIGNAQDVKDALAFFLADRIDKDSSKWIVRDFEQIDGAVLLSQSTKAETYHFSLLSNEHMFLQAKDELPWPLTEDIFTSYSEVKNALTAVTAEHRERRNFLKYALFYGSFFSKKKVVYSYISEENGEEQSPYYLFKALGIKTKPYKETKAADFIMGKHSENTALDKYEANSEAATELYSVCPYKFLLHEVLKSDILYYSEFHLKYYLSFYITCVVKKKARGNKALYPSILNAEIQELRKFMPFWGDVIFTDIHASASENLELYPFSSEKIEQRKANFLVASWIDPETQWKLDFKRPGLSWRMVKYLNNGARIYPTKDEIPCRAVCDNCNFENICLRHYYEAHADTDLEEK